MSAFDALILAGGRGQRLAGKDKGWIMWDGLPLIEHVLARLHLQDKKPERILISANRNLDAYKQTGYLVVSDERPDFPGPLAGIEAGLLRCKRNRLLVVPCDTPLIPTDLHERLDQAMNDQPNAKAAYATTSDGPEPLCCLLDPLIGASLSHFLSRGHGSVISWLEDIKAVAVEFSDPDAFRNFNTPEIFDSKRST
ncbi:molybdenum cofactor guanylyltransferase [Orrella sp. NBD-18]|uniref:Molybdenum cofactor guanylyltransferase n=1 Tax=Sheuella amnicola TaxID=2707330 RepID=A0A6B2QXI3_9BURK|nr:molybdenum cofactor guanylyltransferase MobA [Sheuella amnicola]NDY82741.1 molybdenum cofactor guanylyltransferase [Sheuella amnicola]